MKKEDLKIEEAFPGVNMFPTHLNPMDMQFVRSTTPIIKAILLSELLR